MSVPVPLRWTTIAIAAIVPVAVAPPLTQQDLASLGQLESLLEAVYGIGVHDHVVPSEMDRGYVVKIELFDRCDVPQTVHLHRLPEGRYRFVDRIRDGEGTRTGGRRRRRRVGSGRADAAIDGGGALFGRRCAGASDRGQCQRRQSGASGPQFQYVPPAEGLGGQHRLRRPRPRPPRRRRRRRKLSSRQPPFNCTCEEYAPPPQFGSGPTAASRPVSSVGVHQSESERTVPADAAFGIGSGGGGVGGGRRVAAVVVRPAEGDGTARTG
mmetsp:Transcript_39622/g.118980  ORF Transcript_39622/g.118980 Transcript_39622/m.118980 type:complete len:268 (+) Transcript_39622:1036-1839(+)